jgi:hypothetical protein
MTNAWIAAYCYFYFLRHQRPESNASAEQWNENCHNWNTYVKANLLGFDTACNRDILRNAKCQLQKEIGSKQLTTAIEELVAKELGTPQSRLGR